MISLEDIKQELPSLHDLPSLPDLPSIHDVTEFVSRLDPRTRRRRRWLSTGTAVLAGIGLAVVAGVIAAFLLRRRDKAPSGTDHAENSAPSKADKEGDATSRAVRSA